MWTLKDIEELKRKGKIRGYVDHGPKKQNPNGRIVSKHFTQRTKEKDRFTWNLWKWSNDNALQLLEEYQFHPERKWRFDFCWKAIKVAVEYEGIMSDQSRHTNRKGYTKDSEKYNAAQRLGWTVLRYTAMNADQVIKDLNSILDGMGKGSK